MSDTQPKMAIRTSSKPLTTEYDVMFDKMVEGPNEHQEELYIMRQAVEGDVVNMRINTDGGRISTVSAVQGIIAKSSAHFHAILESDASSAGSTLFLLADSQEVYPLATMYIHTCQSGMSGHSQEMQSYGSFIGNLSEKLVNFVYKDFLTEDEIGKVLSGGVVWLQSEDITERLLKRQEAREQEAVEEMKKQYTPEFYSQQCALDIIEDCAQFGYDPVALAAEIFNLCQDSVEGADDEGILEPLETGEVCIGVSGTETIDIYNTQDIEELKEVATNIQVKFPHNIKLETLRKKVIEKVEK